jgi:hypothetical protein
MPFADRDDAHAGDGRADRKGHHARQPLPAHREDPFAEMVELLRKGLAVAIDEEERDQHEKERQEGLEGGGADHEHAAIDIADIGAADELHQFPESARVTDIFDPLFAEPGAHRRDRRQPGRRRRAVRIGRNRPYEPIAHLFHGIDRGERDRHDDKGDDRNDGDRRGKSAVSVQALKQPPIDGPARKADDHRRKHRHEETMKEIDAAKQNENEQPPGRRNRHDEGGA